MPLSKPGSFTIAATHGESISLSVGQSIKIHNTHGNQVVDTWAFTKTPASYMSMSQTRASLRKLIPHVNDTLLNNLCTPILTLVEDTSPGIHDTLFPACNPQRYAHLGIPHRSCAENCREAAREIGIELAEGEVPDPFNLFMNVNVDWDKGGAIELLEPRSRPGDYVAFKAEVDCIVVLSACPNDITNVNGMFCRDVLFEVL